MYVGHMTDEQLQAFLEPWRRLAEAMDPDPATAEYPAWFIRRRNEARRRLLAVLSTRLSRN